MPKTILTDEYWEKLLKLMFYTGRVYNKPEHRKTFEGILYRMRVGCPWRDILRVFLLNVPMLMSVILLSGLFVVFITPKMLTSLFSGDAFFDTLSGTFIGEASVGQPFISYLIGGELLDDGMSYYAVAAFILSWVALGIVQLPYEYSLCGGRFTFTRNILAFIFALIISVTIVQTLVLLA